MTTPTIDSETMRIVAFRLPLRLAQLLKAVAAGEGRSMQAVATDAISTFLIQERNAK